MKLRLSLSHSLLVVALFCQGYSPARADESSEGRNLLRLIAKEQQKNIDKLPPLKWSSMSSVKVFVPGKERESINERLNIRSGNSGWGKTTIRWRGFEGGSGEPQGEGTNVTVWNDRYIAKFTISTTLATMWEFDSPESLPEPARLTRGGAGAFPERVCAFGHVGKTLLEWLETEDFSSMPVKVTREGEGTAEMRYRVELFFPDQPYPSIEWSVDPSRGYMIVAGGLRHVGLGYKKMEFTVSGREVAPGVWFPTQWEKIHYGDPDPVTGQQAIVKTDNWDATELEVNPVIPDSQFEWSALELKPSTAVLRIDVTGERTSMRVVKGELVPISQVSSNPK